MQDVIVLKGDTYWEAINLSDHYRYINLVIIITTPKQF